MFRKYWKQMTLNSCILPVQHKYNPTKDTESLHVLFWPTHGTWSSASPVLKHPRGIQLFSPLGTQQARGPLKRIASGHEGVHEIYKYKVSDAHDLGCMLGLFSHFWLLFQTNYFYSLPTQWTWVWANSRRQWRTGQPRVLQFMGVTKSQTQLSDWTTTTKRNTVCLG